MDNMIVVALMVVAMIILNPILYGTESKKVAPAASKAEVAEDDLSDEDDSDEDVVVLEDEDNTEKN